MIIYYGSRRYDPAIYNYAKQLNIHRKKFELTLEHKKMNSDDCGCTTVISDRHYKITLYTPQKPHELFITLAHEMVHVRQILLGYFDGEVDIIDGRQSLLWKGIPHTLDSNVIPPWEHEAYKLQQILYTNYLKHK